jgi:hypothetical protein
VLEAQALTKRYQTLLAEEERSDPVTGSEVEVPPGFMSGGADGTRTRDLRRDRPAF